MEPTAETYEWMRNSRGVRTPCGSCAGFGNRMYSNTSTWRHGIGGQSLTWDVCDSCWGSGDMFRHGANLRKLYDELKKFQDKVMYEL